MKKKKINLKPIDIDLHLKYRCPNSKCNANHWLSLQESKTPKFKIVCDSCGLVSRPKVIHKVKILYKKSTKPKIHEQPIQEPEKPTIPQNFLDDGTKTLMNYGFTKTEAITLLTKSFENNTSANLSDLMRYILLNLETLNNA